MEMDGFADDSELRTFLLSLEKRTPTKNMMLWMKYYDEPCEKICCHSTHCGSIRCSGCLCYLSGCPPSTRIQCIECEILPPETVFDSRPELCEKCFNSPLFLHHHQKWLKVDQKGYHSLVTRREGLAELKELQISDFPIITDDIIDSCVICSDDFSKDNPAVSYPGCPLGHGAAEENKSGDIIDTKKYSHASCLLYWFKSSRNETYCGELNYCRICGFIKEKNGWKNHLVISKQLIIESLNDDSNLCNVFDIIEKQLTIKISPEERECLALLADKEMISSQLLKMVFDKLSALHPQEWLKKIIKEVY